MQVDISNVAIYQNIDYICIIIDDKTLRRKMSQHKNNIASSRLNIPISPEIRTELEEIATSGGYSLAEIGRQALETFLAEHRNRARLARLCTTAVKYADIIESVSEDWRSTEVEGWSDEQD